MVTCVEQYSHHNLYVYTGRQSVCYYDYINYYGQSEHHPNLYCGCTHLFRSHSDGTADDFHQWHYGVLVTGFG